MNKKSITTMTGTAILAAIVFVLQTVIGGLRVGPFNITLSLFPIVIGSVLYGAVSGAFLGFVFGILVCISVVSGQDAGGFILFGIHPVITLLLCLLKGTAAGYAAGTVARKLMDKNLTLAVILSGILAPVVNAGIFVLSLFLFFGKTLATWAQGSGNILPFVITGLLGINFLVETGINVVLAPIVVRIVKAIQKNRSPEER